VISRTAVDELVLSTMSQASSMTPNCINFDEYFLHTILIKILNLVTIFLFRRYKRMVGDSPLQIAPLTLNISAIITEYTTHSGVTFATPRAPSVKTIHPAPSTAPTVHPTTTVASSNAQTNAHPPNQASTAVGAHPTTNAHNQLPAAI
jgi:hypothetical protein